MSVPWCACAYSVPIMRGAPNESPNECGTPDREHEAVDDDVGPGGEHGQVDLRGDVGPPGLDHARPRLGQRPARSSTSRSAVATRSACVACAGGEVLLQRLLVGVEHRAEQRVGRGELVRVARGHIGTKSSMRPRTVALTARASKWRRAASTRRTADAVDDRQRRDRPLERVELAPRARSCAGGPRRSAARAAPPRPWRRSAPGARPAPASCVLARGHRAVGGTVTGIERDGLLARRPRRGRGPPGRARRIGGQRRRGRVWGRPEWIGTVGSWSPSRVVLRLGAGGRRPRRRRRTSAATTTVDGARGGWRHEREPAGGGSDEPARW